MIYAVHLAISSLIAILFVLCLIAKLRTFALGLLSCVLLSLGMYNLGQWVVGMPHCGCIPGVEIHPAVMFALEASIGSAAFVTWASLSRKLNSTMRPAIISALSCAALVGLAFGWSGIIRRSIKTLDENNNREHQKEAIAIAFKESGLDTSRPFDIAIIDTSCDECVRALSDILPRLPVDSLTSRCFILDKADANNHRLMTHPWELPVRDARYNGIVQSALALPSLSIVHCEGTGVSVRPIDPSQTASIQKPDIQGSL
jgi:hypothetical protein